MPHAPSRQGNGRLQRLEVVTPGSPAGASGQRRQIEQNRALAAREEAAKVTGNWIADTASTVGGDRRRRSGRRGSNRSR